MLLNNPGGSLYNDWIYLFNLVAYYDFSLVLNFCFEGPQILIILVYCCFNNELICSKMSMKNGTETGESGEGMWTKQDLWILEEAMAIYSGKVIISAYICSGKDSYLFRKQSNGIYGLSHVYDHKEMIFKIIYISKLNLRR